MTNDQNIVRARHVDSLAADLSDFVTQSNDELYQAVQAELADLTPAETSDDTQVVLGSNSSTVDGTLWLEDVTNAAPVVKLYHGGNVYDFPTTPDFTVIDHSAATVGQKFTVTSDVTSVVGSAYNDSITVTGSYCTIFGGDNTAKSGRECIILSPNTNFNSVYITSGSSIQVSAKTGGSCHFFECTGGAINLVNQSSYCTIVADGVDSLRVNCPTMSSHNYLNFISGTTFNAPTYGDMNTVVCGTAGHFHLENKGEGNVFICGTGEHFVSFYGKKCTVCNFSNNDTLSFQEKATIPSWDASLNSSTILITLDGNADNVLTLQDYTATQFLISRPRPNQSQPTSYDVYTIQGSSLVLAGS